MADGEDSGWVPPPAGQARVSPPATRGHGCARVPLRRGLEARG